MDWIKVLNKHILFEYSDLRDSEFAAWIKIMALTAQLEHIPTREQMLQYVHYKTLDSLQEKLNKHSIPTQDMLNRRSIDLQYILNKVLMDVQYVSNRREQLKKNTQRYRDKSKFVIDDVMIMSQIREDKIREDKIREDIKEKGEESPPLPSPEIKTPKKKPIPPLIDEVKIYCQERKNNIDPEAWMAFYNSNGWMVGKNRMRDWKSAIITWEKRGGNGDGNNATTGRFSNAGFRGRTQEYELPPESQRAVDEANRLAEQKRLAKISTTDNAAKNA